MKIVRKDNPDTYIECCYGYYEADESFIFHREDGPAIEYKNGSKGWWTNGKRHRENGPAFISGDGIRYWYGYDVLHRLDDPAVEYPGGTKEWWVNGKRHCSDGPAIIWADGAHEWWFENKQIPVKSQEEFKLWLKYKDF